jgi:hypothetical protein
MAVKGARLLRVHRSEAKTLDGHRSAGYAASTARMPPPRQLKMGDFALFFLFNKFACANRKLLDSNLKP